MAVRLPKPHIPRPLRTWSARRQVQTASNHLYCEADDWAFDPRYTEGRCPICGWSPEGTVVWTPRWLRAYRATDWEIIGLAVLLVVLVVLGLFVARAAGVDWSGVRP